MAAPVDSARVATNVTSASTTWNINVGSPVADTLLIVWVRFADDPGAITFTGYNVLAGPDSSDASSDTSVVYWRWADGAEGASDVLSPTNSVKGGAISWEVTGAANETPGVSTVAVGTSANTASPNSVAPNSPPQDTLYIAMMGQDNETFPSAAPTNYVNLTTANSGTTGQTQTNVTLAGASRELTASSSEDAGAFTHTSPANGWTAFAVAIRPPSFQPRYETVNFASTAVLMGGLRDTWRRRRSGIFVPDLWLPKGAVI